jgi:hypothetical protein
MPSANSGRASVHAYRAWTCPCGRRVKGNGGKSAHKRACPTYRLLEADRADRNRERDDRRRNCPEGRARPSAPLGYT